MTLKELAKIKRQWFDKNLPYQMTYWQDFEYESLNNILYQFRRGRGSNHSVNDVIIAADTETSKKPDRDDNHVCAWTITIRAFSRNIVTLWGHRPSSFCAALYLIMDNLNGSETIIYFHNLAYDWVFLRKFLFERFGHPDKQLNTKSHYPILIQWSNGLTIKDSLILAQRSLDKWSKDLDVEHQKAVGKWDYDRIRNQDEVFTSDELEYIEHDTLALAECIEATMKSLNKLIYSIPYTATGIPRGDIRKIGHQHSARDLFERIHLEYDDYIVAEQTYHGGFTHSNRYVIEDTIKGSIKCKDFASSYPFTMIASNQFPISKFTPSDCDLEQIDEYSDKYAFMFKLCLIKPVLKEAFCVMPYLQFSKCTESINNINDNGRILKADYVELYITEFDWKIIKEQYTWQQGFATDVRYTNKGYLPRWFTDYIFNQFCEKSKYKGLEDKKVEYALSKGRLNSLYGMCVQKPLKETLVELYETGDYIEEKMENPEEEYEKYINRKTSILPYQWGVWVTAIATYRLFKLGECVDYENGGEWLYSDTDSCYATKWNEERVKALNQEAKDALIANGYGAAIVGDKEYWLGVAEDDGEYSEFRTCGAKRYACRDASSGKLKITVSGVPKEGVKCLNDNIDNFTRGMVFNGKTTGKLTHMHIFIDSIYTDEQGNETGDSINLYPCDYLLNSIYAVNWDALFSEELEVQYYDSSTV